MTKRRRRNAEDASALEIIGGSVERFVEHLPVPLNLPFLVFAAERERRRAKRIDAELRRLAVSLVHAKADIRALDKKGYYQTDYFLTRTEELLQRLANEAEERKRDALRGALTSIVIDRPKFTEDKRSSFLRSLGLLDGLHLRVLQLLAKLPDARPKSSGVSVAEIVRLMGATDESDANLIYSAIDTLANREYVLSGPIPFRTDGSLDKPRQAFRMTPLGKDFLRFIFTAEQKRTSEAP